MALSDRPERHDSMEHYRDYSDGLAVYPFMYYCRRCIRNFNTKVRVRVCNKCLKEDIVELPANVTNVPTSRLRFGSESRLAFFNKRLSELRKPKIIEDQKTKDVKFQESIDKLKKRWADFVERMKKQDQKELEENKEKKSLRKSGIFIVKQKEELPSYAYKEDEKTSRRSSFF